MPNAKFFMLSKFFILLHIGDSVDSHEKLTEDLETEVKKDSLAEMESGNSIKLRKKIMMILILMPQDENNNC